MGNDLSQLDDPQLTLMQHHAPRLAVRYKTLRFTLPKKIFVEIYFSVAKKFEQIFSGVFLRKSGLRYLL